MIKQYDIIIVGSGLVGSALAAALGTLPISVALLEAAPRKPVTSTQRDERSIVLSYGSSQILTGVGVWSALQPHATPIAQIHISDAGHFGITRMNASEEGVPALGYVINAERLLTELTLAAKQPSNVTLLQPARVTAMTALTEGWQVDISHAEQACSLQAKLVIACDGQQSTVRNLQNIEVETFDYQQTAIVSTLQLAHPHQHVAYERFTKQGSIAFLPRQNNQVGLVWSVPSALAASKLALTDAEFLTELQTQFGYRLGRLQSLGKRFSYPLKLMQTQHQVGPGWVLLGNAAQTLHPIAAQGFNLGLRDMAQLGDIIAHAIASQAPLAEAVQTQYQQRRKADQRATIALTHHMVRCFSHDIWPVRLGRNLMTAGLNLLPFAKRRVARHSMGLITPLSRLQRGLSLN